MKKINEMIETVPIDSVILNQDNPRILKDDKFKKLVKSVKEFPQMLEIRPIVVNSEMVVLGGNMRLEACKKAGLKQVTILKADNLTDEQQKEFIIKDNVGFGEWDWDVINNEWNTDEVEEWGLDIPVFEDLEVLEAEEDEFDVPEGGIETDIVVGDLFEIGEHRLLCGDSTCSDTVGKLMNGEKADMVFTDPPFPNNSEIMHDMIKNIDEAFNNSRIFCDGLMVWFWDNLEFPPFLEMVTSKHIWHKTNGWQANHFETMYAYHNDETRHEQLIFSVNNVGGENNRDEQGNHPTPKPVKLISNVINEIAGKYISVLDLFLGSGTTMLAAHQLKRKCYGMELDPKYCQVIVDRMLKLEPTLEVKLNGKKYEPKTID